MFTPLPKETVFEARAKARRDTVMLVLLLFSVYGACFALMAVAVLGSLGGGILVHGAVGKIAFAGLLVGVAFALGHYLVASMRSLDDLLVMLSARQADPEDEYHDRLVRLVREAETATGLRGIQTVVIPTPGMNAFSLADRKGHMAIGATEGLISRLSRNELGAVVAHEAAHLVQGDSRLLTVAGSLSSSFESITDVLSPANLRATHRGGRYGSGRDRGAGGAVLLVWIIALVGKFITMALSMALSRNRESMADAQAVRMTKNPLALADALKSIAGKYRGGGEPPPGFQAVFILNPEAGYLDESYGAIANLFSTHPPVAQRIEKLLAWAKSDARFLPRMKEPAATPASKIKKADPRYFAFLGDKWQGPYNFPQMLASGAVTPTTWVCPAGSDSVAKAGKSADLSPLFTDQIKGKVSKNKCPHCHVPLVEKSYEGTQTLHCTFCSGYLLKSGVLERIVARHDEKFDEALVEKAVAWRKAQPERSLREAPSGLVIPCPECARPMGKAFHLMLTRVVMDRCSYDGRVWLDGGELETIQILVEDSSKK